MKKIKFGYIFLLPVLLSLLAGIWIPTHNPVPVQHLQAVAGILDVSKWDAQSVVELQGEWEYDDDSQQTPQLVSLPHLFPRNAEWGGNACGFATYRLMVQGLSPEKEYGIQVIDIATAYRMVINGDQILTAGQVAADPDEHRPMMLEQVGFFRADEAGQAEILLTVSNFSYFEGGFRNFITLGTVEQMTRYASYQDLVEIFLFATILSLGLFFLAVYTVYRRFDALLYFSLLSIINAIRVILRGHRQIYDLLPQIPWDLTVRLEFLAGYLALPAFGLFLYSMDYVKRNRFLKLFYYSFGIVVFMICYLTPNEIYANPLPYYVRLMQGFMVYFAYVLGRGMLARRWDAILLAATSFFLFLGVLYDYFIRGFNAMIPVAVYTMTIILTVILTNQIRNTVVNTSILAYQLQDSLTAEQRLRERLEVLDHIKNEFLANTSHELRTPLNSIINITESVLERGDRALTRLQEDNLNLVVASGKRLLRLINDLLDITRIRHQDLMIKPRDLQLKKVLEPVVQVFRYTTDNSRITFHTKLPEQLWIHADENRLIQILYNLLGNAQKFTAKGTITVSAEQSGELALIMIEDTGEGISPERLELIMHPDDDVRLEHLQNEDILGMGLAITRQLVTLMGGTLWIESVEHHGTRCFFTLPMATESGNSAELASTQNFDPTFRELDKKEEAAEQEQREKEQHEKEQREQEQREKKVLVVDDEYINFKTIINVLSPDGYTFLQAATGQEALDLIAKNKDLSLVILDVMLPELSGYEVCRRIRESYTINELPILMMTAAKLDHDVAMGFSSGANDFLNKPFASEELRARVKTLINMKVNYDHAISSEIAFLHAQIKPHFLHNVLNTLSHLTVEDPAKAERLVENISVYLRNNFEFYDLESLIPLEKELETIDAYIAIEMQRFGERIHYECQVEDAIQGQISQILIPPLVLQPLVENSVRHGISKKIGGGVVTLAIGQSPEGITFTVADDGVGMSEEIVLRVLSGQKPGSVGIRNINTRLKRTYGTTLACQSIEGQGTQISFIIRKEQDHVISDDRG